MTELMDIIWENLKCSATEDTLRGSLRIRDVTAIIKLKFGLSAGDIKLEQVLEGMLLPEQARISVLKPQEPQDEVFIVGRSYVVKKARSYEEMDTMPSSSQSPSRKRIRSDSDTWEDEMAELYAQTLESRKGSSSSPVNRAQVAEEMKTKKEKYRECSVPIAYAGFRAMHRQGEPQEYRHRKDYADEPWSRISFKGTRECYLGLKPEGKKGQIDAEFRLIQFNR